MALNLKNAEVERLAEEVARLAGETKTETVRRALAERRDRLVSRTGGLSPGQRLQAYLEEEVWPSLPPGGRGRRLSRKEEDEILGYGEPGVRFGRGRHPAGLNFGDCLSYAVAHVAREPLLFVGDDFARTDVQIA